MTPHSRHSLLHPTHVSNTPTSIWSPNAIPKWTNVQAKTPHFQTKLARLFWTHATNSDCHFTSLGQNNTERWENNWSDKAEASESAHTEGQWFFFYFNFVVLVLYLRVLASLLLLEVWGRCASRRELSSQDLALQPLPLHSACQKTEL